MRPKSFVSSNNQILFLNEGCKLSKTNKRFKYELYKNNIVLNYKKTSPGKDFYYILKIYELLLKTLTSRLNKIHNLNYSVESWRIIIGPWLFEFISIIYQNWKIIKYIKSNYLIKYVELAKFKKKNLNFKDYNDFSYSTLTDEFNNQIYEDLLNYFKKIKIKYFFSQKKKKKQNKKSVVDFILNFLNSLSLFVNLFQNMKFFFHESYFNIIFNSLLYIRLGQFPTFFRSPPINGAFLRKKFRKNNLDYQNNKFLNILNDLIFKYIPLSYIENFNKYQEKVQTINWPKNPQIIFSSNSFFHDDFFKIWLVNKKENFSSKFISGQHGGAFFNSRYHFYELHQKKISDQILTWGYKKEDIYKPMFNFKVANKYLEFNPQGNILFVDYELPRFVGPHFNKLSNLSFISSKINFLENLRNNIRNKLIFRPYPSADTSEIIDRINKIDKFIKIDTNKNIYVSLNNIRICIVNQNSTVFLETLNLNLPTIIYFDPNQDIIRNDAKLYFDLLKKVNIYFDNSTTAAKHLNNIWDQVDKWWYDKKTQNAINSFCDRYSKKIIKPLDEISSFFKNSLE